MALATNQKITQYKAIITAKLKNSLTAAQYTQAMNDKFITMWDIESGGSVSNKLSVVVDWLKNAPLASKFFTTTSTAQTDFMTTIASTPAVTAADALPSTYTALHAETVANEPKIAGVLALRALGVDSTYMDDGANLGAGTAGAVLSSANVMALYTTWGATKFNAILNKNFLTSIVNETNAAYDTLAEVSAVYSAWTNTVNVNTFFAGVAKLVGAGVTGLQFSDVMADANNVANFNLHTSDAVATLMGSTGGTWAAVTALSAAELSALTSTNAINIIKHCGGTYTNLDAIYTADTTKFYSLTSNNATNLMLKGYAGVDLPGLSTAYGTTYTAVADARFNNIVDPKYADLWAKGITYATMSSAYTANQLKDITPDITQVLYSGDPTNFNANVAVLVAASATFGGLETLGYM
ncbi:MAG: hypothetical protein K0R73_1219 [Candidatus Midichloriaceae bacterium]|jgi:hypothetical protein|nr:hypothetical protein [Candidatus Midichloriaceae bacterium]